MAEISLARVDFRLIHGQIIVKWRKVFEVNKIIVIDDILACDEFMTRVYASAAPSDVVVTVSYTHLDVYKRQGQCSICSRSARRDTFAAASSRFTEYGSNRKSSGRFQKGLE